MPSYPLDHQSEVDRALRSSLEMHSPRLPPSSANIDLALNPLREMAKKNPLVPEGSAYLGPKRTADEPETTAIADEPDLDLRSTKDFVGKVKAQPYPYLLGAAGAGLLLGWLWKRQTR